MPGNHNEESMSFHDSGILDKDKGREVLDNKDLRRICLHCGYRKGYHYFAENNARFNCPTQKQIAEKIL